VLQGWALTEVVRRHGVDRKRLQGAVTTKFQVACRGATAGWVVQRNLVNPIANETKLGKALSLLEPDRFRRNRWAVLPKT